MEGEDEALTMTLPPWEQETEWVANRSRRGIEEDGVYEVGWPGQLDILRGVWINRMGFG